jgi:hypothetical protein
LRSCFRRQEALWRPHNDWILFEAGALSKRVESTHVCPLLFGLEPSDVDWPLAQFQLTPATKGDLFRLLKTMIEALSEHAIPETDLSEQFEVCWPKLDEKLRNLPAEESKRQPRQERELLEEILALVRSQVRQTPVEPPEREIWRTASQVLGMPISEANILPEPKWWLCKFRHPDGRVGIVEIPYTTPQSRLADVIKEGFAWVTLPRYRSATSPDTVPRHRPTRQPALSILLEHRLW